MPYNVVMGGILFIKFKVYVMDVLDYVLVSTHFMLLVFVSIKIVIKYPSNDCNYISKIDIDPLMILFE